MDQPKAPTLSGCKFLKVSGVLLIILSALGVAAGPLSILGGMSMAAPEMAALLGAQAAAMASSAIQAGTIMLVTSVISLAGGILGVKFCNRADRAVLCLAAGGVMAVQQLVSGLILALQGSFDLFSTALNLVFPLLFLWGALRNLPGEPVPLPARPQNQGQAEETIS